MSFDRRIIFEKVGLNISIYVPQKQSANYIKYDYLYINKPSINMKQWRVSKVYVVDENLNILYDFDTQTEWEGAILEKGMPEAIGGYHGNEKNITLHVLLDGKEIDINMSDFKKEVFEEVKITNVSVLNRYNNPSVDLFKRLRVNIWNKEENIIVSHMFPLGEVKPNCKESWMVTLVDKLVALYECGTYKFREKLSIAFLTSFNAEFLADIAISTPTFSNNGIFKTFDTRAITLFTPNCFARREQRRFRSSLLVTLITTSQEPISSSSKSFKSVPSPFKIKVFESSSDIQ